MPTTWQTVRVFISSTFRDMHAERDWLVKRVFPALRERLEKYRIHLIDIDLRWGVTEEEAEKDQVLDLCLSQIDECRPFFVGILGERYGWVPESFTEEAASKYGWVQHQTGKSVTELEILYGVLRNPEMHPHSLFLFRNPAFTDEVPEAKRDDVLAEPPATIKPRIVTSTRSNIMSKPFALTVKALVADDEDRVLVIRRSMESSQFKHNWDLPGGKVDPGEAFDVALAREVAEETGLSVTLEGVAGATEYDMPTVRLAVLVLEARRVGGEVRLSNEHDAFDWVARAKLAEVGTAGQLKAFLTEYCGKLPPNA